MISYKSHSGKKSNFSKTLSKNLFTISESNFGMAPQRRVTNSKLDTVILLSETKAIMITSEYCHYEDYDGRDRSRGSLWNAGKDTVLDHPLFNSTQSIQEIKKSLKSEYYFANSIDSVVFIGFDGEFYKENPKKSKAKVEERSIEQLVQEGAIEEKAPKKHRSLFMLFIISFFSVIYHTGIR